MLLMACLPILHLGCGAPAQQRELAAIAYLSQVSAQYGEDCAAAQALVLCDFYLRKDADDPVRRSPVPPGAFRMLTDSQREVVAIANAFPEVRRLRKDALVASGVWGYLNVAE